MNTIKVKDLISQLSTLNQDAPITLELVPQDSNNVQSVIKMVEPLTNIKSIFLHCSNCTAVNVFQFQTKFSQEG